MLKSLRAKLADKLLKSSKRLGPKNDIQRDMGALDVPDTHKSFSFRQIFDDIKNNWVDSKQFKNKH